MPKDNLTAQKALEDTKVLDYIFNLGFSSEVVEDFGGYYLVEGDLVFVKNDNRYKKIIDKAQAASATKVSYQKISDVTVVIDGSIPSGGPDDWRLAIATAINYWNNNYSTLPSTRIHFNLLLNGPADITIRDDQLQPLANVVLATGEYPSNGMPGSTIRINLDFNGNYELSTDQKIHNMVHELGHNIGFAHTNWSSLNETGKQIPGTPCSESGSVMNGQTPLNVWQGFSHFDVIAAQIMYPIDRPAGTYPFHRYYSSTTGDHFYTIYWGELGCGAGGYVIEGNEGYIFLSSTAGTVPIYRYYSPSFGDHFYTRYFTTYANYYFESIAGYGYDSNVPGTIPIYRYYNGQLNDHFYTKYNTYFPGYVSEGIAWYAIP